VALPVKKRSLKMKQFMRAEAIQAFEEWQAKPDKIPY
jgi:hypothetical protein